MTTKSDATVSLTDEGHRVVAKLFDEIEACLLARGEDNAPLPAADEPTRCAHCRRSIRAHAIVRKQMKQTPWPQGVNAGGRPKPV